MTRGRLVLASLMHYRRTHAGVVLGAVTGAAVLVGALLVGDSVRGTLRTIADARIGRVHSAMATNDRYFRSALVNELSGRAAAALVVNGIAAAPDGSARAKRVQILGVDERFWLHAPDNDNPIALADDQVAINARLASQLGAKPGDTIVLRVERPSLLPRDMPLAQVDDAAAALRLTVHAIIGNEQFGNFNLAADQTPPYNAFVSRELLAEKLDLAGKTNLMLTRTGTDTAAQRFRSRWTLPDAQLIVRPLPDQPLIELRSERVFIDQTYVDAARDAIRDARFVLTYFVNRIGLDDRSTPYSTVTATNLPITKDLGPSDAAISAWLAEDLEAEIGDHIVLTYYVPGADRRLTEQARTFRVAKIVPMDDPALDPTLMPDFPGLADAEHCREWDAGFPVDYQQMREKDEAYWSKYRGTPKAFIRYDTGAAIWGNRFGVATAVRMRDTPTNQHLVDWLVREKIDPRNVGYKFVDIRRRAEQAAEQSLDFGALFLSMSFFLVTAAAVLTGLLFVFGMEQRSREVGTLLAVGWPQRRVMRVLMIEGFLLAVIGSAMGTAVGVGYTRLILHALNTIWRDAVASAALQFHADNNSLIGGGLAGVAIAMAAMWLTLRRSIRRPARELLTGQHRHAPPSQTQAIVSRWVAVVSLFAAIALLWLTRGASGAEAAGVFFGVGALLLITALATCRVMLSGAKRMLPHGELSLTELALRQAMRRRGRSLAVVTLIACGSFLIVAVGANRQDPSAGRGAGGFGFYGETTLPLLHDLNTTAGRDAFSLDEHQMQNVKIVPMRLRDGDDASCLNLNAARSPRLIGVAPGQLTGRFGDVDWTLLSRTDGDVVPAIGDEATVMWSLYKKVGDTMDYVGESGESFKLRIVAMIPNSVFQGSLLIGETPFEKHFPSESGYRAMLIDGPPATRTDLTQALADLGPEITSTGARLAMFNAVQNTYLSIFAALGGLGMILGSVGLGAVVLRNLMERRSELAVMTALGFRRPRLYWLIFFENGLLLEIGLLCGVVSAIVAVWPALRGSGGDIPYLLLIALIVLIWASGIAWISIAGYLSLRGSLIQSLRSE